MHLFVEDVDAAEAFYTDTVGFVKTEESTYHGARCVFLRAGSEHHSLACSPKNYAPNSGSVPTPRKSFRVEVGSYQQLREAVAFLKAHGVTMLDPLPPSFHSVRTTSRTPSILMGTVFSCTTTWSRLAGTVRCVRRASGGV